MAQLFLLKIVFLKKKHKILLYNTHLTFFINAFNFSKPLLSGYIFIIIKPNDKLSFERARVKHPTVA